MPLITNFVQSHFHFLRFYTEVSTVSTIQLYNLACYIFVLRYVYYVPFYIFIQKFLRFQTYLPLKRMCFFIFIGSLYQIILKKNFRLAISLNNGTLWNWTELLRYSIFPAISFYDFDHIFLHFSTELSLNIFYVFVQNYLLF